MLSFLGSVKGCAGRSRRVKVGNDGRSPLAPWPGGLHRAAKSPAREATYSGQGEELHLEWFWLERLKWAFVLSLCLDPSIMPSLSFVLSAPSKEQMQKHFLDFFRFPPSPQETCFPRCFLHKRIAIDWLCIYLSVCHKHTSALTVLPFLQSVISNLRLYKHFTNSHFVISARKRMCREEKMAHVGSQGGKKDIFFSFSFSNLPSFADFTSSPVNQYLKSSTI